MSNWQPIETAPKDGTWLWLCEYAGPDLRSAFYAGAWNVSGAHWMANCGQPVVQEPEPTHWQPLPEPPEPGQ